MRPALALLVLALCPVGVPASDAAASTAEYYQAPFFIDPDDDSCRPGICDPPPPTIIVKGEPGERNDLQIARDAQTLVIRDAGALLKAGNRCAAESDGAVRCPAAGVSVQAGDGDDRVADGAGGTVDGGPGNDVVASGSVVLGGEGDDVLSGATALDGGPGDDMLNGGEGPQSLTPGPGADRVTAGPGDDLIIDEPATPAADLIDAGDGVDALLFTGRRAPVTVDLGPATQTAGSPGEGNQITGLELASGGSGDDTLTLGLPVGTGAAGGPGSSSFSPLELGRGADRLTLAAEVRIRVHAGPGDDVLSGSAGRDAFDAGAGRDTVDGFGGPDELFAGIDRIADVVRGGPGNDRVVGESARRGHGDLLDGGSGRDSVWGGAGPDRLYGRAGDDELRGDAGRDVVDGGPGRDRAFGGSGRDLVRGGPGADRLAGEGPEIGGFGAAAVDRIRGGGGNDRISSVDRFRRRADRVDCGAGTADSLRADRLDRVRRCERVRRRR